MQPCLTADRPPLNTLCSFFFLAGGAGATKAEEQPHGPQGHRSGGRGGGYFQRAGRERFREAAARGGVLLIRTFSSSRA